jgi:anti-anti-sigma factor
LFGDVGVSVALQISIRKAADVTILDLRGRATIGDDAELFSNQLKKLIVIGALKVLLNLADLSQIDSSAFSIIIETFVSLKRKGGELKLLRPRGRVLEVLTVFRMFEVISSFEDEAQALASFRAEQTHCGGEVASAAQKTALVVPSGGDVDKLLHNILASEGWSIQQATDNQHALARATSEPFDLIITGRKTLGQEDVELLRKIRSARPHIRLIILTDKFTPGDVLSAMREGAFSYFSAPFEASELADMVYAAMSAPCWDDGIEILSGTPAWVRLAARCDIATANRLVQFLHGVKDPSIPEADRAAVVTAFKEVLLNAMEHGGHFDPSHYVEISFVRMRRVVVCRVKDPGQGFSLEELRHAAVNNPPDDLLGHLAVREAQGLRPGGFGLLLAKKLVDELIYSEHGNDVLLVKYIDQAASQIV